MKKIILLFFCIILLASCGKKGDPIYKDPEKKAKIESFFINKA